MSTISIVSRNGWLERSWAITELCPQFLNGIVTSSGAKEARNNGVVWELGGGGISASSRNGVEVELGPQAPKAHRTRRLLRTLPGNRKSEKANIRIWIRNRNGNKTNQLCGKGNMGQPNQKKNTLSRGCCLSYRPPVLARSRWPKAKKCLHSARSILIGMPVFGLWESALIFRTINGRRNIFGHVARRPATWKPPAPRLSHKCFGPPPGFGHLVEENKAATAPRACAPFLAFLALWLSVPFPHRFWAESSRLFRPAPPLSSSSKLKAFGCRSGKTRAKQPENPKKKNNK